jgi:phage terminase large subunit-like protein
MLRSEQARRAARHESREWTPRPSQTPPPGNWRVWLLLAGRGFGKTRTINEWALTQAKPGTRGAIVAATAADVRDVMIEGESGLHTIAPHLHYEPSKRRITWPNGAQASLFSADEPDRLRGPQFHWAICDELAAWRYPSAWAMLMLGLRLGTDPRCAVATTPRPTQVIRDLIGSSTTTVTRGTTYENRDNLAPAFFEQIITQYEGTRLGRQEINAEILEDVPGALWNRKLLDDTRVSQSPQMTRIVVAVDPETTATETSAETGIGAAGVGLDGHGYVLEDRTIKGSPLTWATQAVSLYHKLKADRIVYEANQGGDMVAHTLHSVDPSVPLKAVHASKNKQARAEPVAALYEQGKAHHVGIFGELEDQQCNWTPNSGQPSPDRLDWCVWALTELMLGSQTWVRKPIGER